MVNLIIGTKIYSYFENKAFFVIYLQLPVVLNIFSFLGVRKYLLEQCHNFEFIICVNLQSSFEEIKSRVTRTKSEGELLNAIC